MEKCDCCEKKTRSLIYFLYLSDNVVCGSIRYLSKRKDGRCNFITVGLCNSCYGRVITSAVNELKVIRNKEEVHTVMCTECPWVGTSMELLKAPNPFIPSLTLTACPKCSNFFATNGNPIKDGCEVKHGR